MMKKICSRRLLVGVLALTLLVVLRDVVGAPVGAAMTLVCFTGAFCMLRYEELVPLLFFVFPLTCGIAGYIMLVGYLVLVYKGHGLCARQIIPVVIIAFLELVSEGTHADGAIYSGMLSFLSFCALFFYFLNDKRRPDYDLRQCIYFFAFGTAVTLGVIFFNMFMQYGADYLLSGMVRSGSLGVEDNDALKMRGHLAMNANTVAYYAICSICSLVPLLRYSQRRLLPVGLLLFIGALGFLSFSRTYVLCLVLFAIGYMFAVGGKEKAKTIALFAVVAVVVSMFAAAYFDAIVNAFVGRTQEESFATAGGRTEIFALYNHTWAQSIMWVLFGGGVVNHMANLHVPEAMHSGLQQVWVCLGLSGLLLFVVQVVAFIRREACRHRLFMLFPFVVTFLFDQSIQFLNPYPLMLPLMVALMVCKANNQYENQYTYNSKNNHE